jgi:hypothetical protein
MAKIKLARVLQLVIKDKYQYKTALETMENDIFLKQAYVNDPQFQKELHALMPETKFLMN